MTTPTCTHDATQGAHPGAPCAGRTPPDAATAAQLLSAIAANARAQFGLVRLSRLDLDALMDVPHVPEACARSERGRVLRHGVVAPHVALLAPGCFLAPLDHIDRWPAAGLV